MPKKLVNVVALLLGLGFLLFESSRSSAQDEDPRLLDQQILKLYQEGKYQEAIPIAEKQLAIREKELGLEHPDTASSFNSLAKLYFQVGDYAKAEPLFQQVLEIWKKVLGPENSITATALGNLALVYDQIGDYAKAEPALSASTSDQEEAARSRAPRDCISPQ
jgi:tetratricopeptide (TPR) repeat protein